MAKNKNIIRVGDHIKIIKPDFFIRCGYENTLDEIADSIREKYHDIITKFMKDVGLETYNERILDLKIDGFDNYEYMNKAHEKICRAIAYEKISKLIKSGNERKLYTERKNEYLDKEGYVEKVFYVKTGIYHPPNFGSYPDGDYYPGYLENETTHKILEVSFITNGINYLGGPAYKFKTIEAKNVIKIFGD